LGAPEYSSEAVNYRFKQGPGNFNSRSSIRINLPLPRAKCCRGRDRRAFIDQKAKN
jgi:hypothetical protein